MQKIKNADMREYTSFKTGGSCDVLLIPESEDDVTAAIKEAEQNPGFTFVLGNGTDVLVKDDGYRGTIIKIGEALGKIDVRLNSDDSMHDVGIEGGTIEAGAGALLSKVAKVARDAGLTGMEAISGIPGSIGGAVFMNAGAYGKEIKDILKSVKVIKRDTLEIEELGASELDLSYRHSVIEETGDIIISAVFELESGDKADIDTRMREFTEKRNAKQPLSYPSAGSFFKRPEGYYAGKLIEDAGLKGLAVGGAKVSEKHSGFIINTGSATASDIIDLMHLVQNTVFDRFGVRLEPEVRIIG